ncbi:regucalcin-like isoform X2 [Oculina patagonica]
MEDLEISVVGKNICAKLGEGPHWDTNTQKLLYVDAFGYSVHVLDVDTGKDKSYQLDDIVGCVVPRKKGGSVIVGCKRRLIFLDLETGEQEVVATVDEDKPENHLNDGKCDPVGRFWVGSMGHEREPTILELEQGSLFSLTGDKKLTKWVDKISISNGMSWSLDKKTFYYIDSVTRKIDAFDYEEKTGAISNRRTAFKFDPSYGYADGMTIDAEGMLWVAMYDGWKVVRFNPVSGEVLREVKLPVAKVTSCCWGGPNLDELFVTCESLRLTPEEKKAQPLAGSIFRVKNLGTHGLPAVPFDG